MYSSFRIARKYFSYYRHASNSKGHGMHSPFVFDFILNVLQNKNHYQPPGEIEALRKKLLREKTVLQMHELGAGSRTHAGQQQTVAQIANAALKSKRLAQVLFRLVKHYQPQSIIELGTSLGLTTSYFSKANPAAFITTIEGNPSVAEKARENFDLLGCSNIELLQGNFDDLLPPALDRIKAVNLGYIDGNHRYQPTISYFNQLLQCSHQNTIMVFDDIHWSAEMEQAWHEIKQHPSVKYTIDIFFLGFVFFRRDFKAKQDFSIRL